VAAAIGVDAADEDGAVHRVLGLFPALLHLTIVKVAREEAMRGREWQ
jgi:hypothetical protein